MKSLQQYRIPFTGLKTGKHQFELDVDKRFFDEFEYSLVKDGQLKVELELDKQETMLILAFHITGDIYLNCDVCLADFPSAIDVKERLIAKYDDEDLEDDTDEIIVLNRNDHEIDVSVLVYEYINLAVPYISRCADEGNTRWCDKDMIAKLKELSGAKEEEQTNSADPRWEALKKIKK